MIGGFASGSLIQINGRHTRRDAHAPRRARDT
jgi:hypothetical protein